MDPTLVALWMTVMIAIVALGVRWAVVSDWRETRWPCLCAHQFRRHASARDSDFGDPGHVGPNYIAPGRCRDCLCRHFIPALASEGPDRR